MSANRKITIAVQRVEEAKFHISSAQEFERKRTDNYPSNLQGTWGHQRAEENATELFAISVEFQNLTERLKKVQA